jgi:hypothetical protein
LACRLLFAVVWSQISPTPAADSAAATAFNISKDLISPEATNWQRSLVMAWPVAFALAEAIDKNWRTPCDWSDAIVIEPAIALSRQGCGTLPKRRRIQHARNKVSARFAQVSFPRLCPL